MIFSCKSLILGEFLIRAQHTENVVAVKSTKGDFEMVQQTSAEKSKEHVRVPVKTPEYFLHVYWNGKVSSSNAW